MHTDLVKPETMAELVARYQQQKADIEAMRPYYNKVKNLLQSGLRHYDKVDFDRTLDSMKKKSWTEIIERCGLFSLMSMEAAEEVKKSLYYDEGKTCEDLGIPDFTVENVIQFIDDRRAAIPSMMDEKILEVYKLLRPQNFYDLKTNKTSLFEGIGNKVILSWFFETNYAGKGLRIRFQKREEVNAIQEVFTLLDGKGIPKDGQKLYYKLHESERGDAYEDEYFRLKGYKNGNIHIEFKRLDLVEKIVSTAKEKLLGAVA